MMVIKEGGPHYPTILVCVVYYCIGVIINITAVMTNCQVKQALIMRVNHYQSVITSSARLR